MIGGGWSMSKNILVVDDVEFNREFDKTLIEKVAHENGIDVDVHTAESVSNAIDILQKRDFKFDCIIVDLNLPDGSGVDIAKAVREHNIDAKIAGITIYPSRYRQYKKFFDYYIPKPIQAEIYRKKLSEFLKD